jgi:outer membrane protein TolC
LQAAQARTRAASAGVDAARAEHRPMLTATTSASRWRETPAFEFAAIGLPFALPLFAGHTFSMTEARVSAPLYSGGGIGANVTAADAAFARGGHTAASLEQEVKLAVATAYVGVLRAASAHAIAAANTASLAAHARDVEDMLRTGQVPRNDYLAAAVSLADAEQRQLDAANALELARAAYNRQLGRPLDAPVDLEPIAPSPGVEQALDQLLATAFAARTELMALDAAVRELDARGTAARAARRPQVTLSGGYTFIENDVLNREDFWSIGVGVRWTPFDGGRARSAAAGLEQQSIAAARDLEHSRSLIELEVRSAWLDERAARARLGVTMSAVAQAEENLRVVRDRYLSGEGTNTEVLDAEALRTASRGNFDNARYDAALAQQRLARAIGRL